MWADGGTLIVWLQSGRMCVERRCRRSRVDVPTSCFRDLKYLWKAKLIESQRCGVAIIYSSISFLQSERDKKIYRQCFEQLCSTSSVARADPRSNIEKEFWLYASGITVQSKRDIHNQLERLWVSSHISVCRLSEMCIGVSPSCTVLSSYSISNNGHRGGAVSQ